jgi:hypothetical protein
METCYTNSQHSAIHIIGHAGAANSELKPNKVNALKIPFLTSSTYSKETNEKHASFYNSNRMQMLSKCHLKMSGSLNTYEGKSRDLHAT